MICVLWTLFYLSEQFSGSYTLIFPQDKRLYQFIFFIIITIIIPFLSTIAIRSTNYIFCQRGEDSSKLELLTL